MIFYLLMGLALYYISLELKKNQDVFAPQASLVAFGCSAIVLSWWFYTYLYIPGMAADLYNSGAGVSYTGNNGTITLYNSTDERMMYSLAIQKNDYGINETLKNFVWLVGAAAIGGYSVFWMWTRNIAGGKRI